MPIFYYSATFDESVACLEDLCANGFQVIPSRTFEQSVAKQYSDITEDLLTLLKEGPGFYLTGPFTKFPVHLKRLQGGPAAGRYMVDALMQGPVLEGLMGRLAVADGEPTLLLGFISRQDQYRNPGTGLWESASSDLKAAYKRAVGIMKNHLIKEQATRFPVGAEARRLVHAGKARLRESFTT